MSARESARRFDIAHDSGFVEVADRCWVARHSLVDVNVGLVGGSRGLVVVDTHSSAATARVVLEQVRALGAGEVVAVVNTHAHWDHVLGNGTFLEEYAGAPVVAHEDAAATLREHGEQVLAEAGRHTDVAGTTVVVPDQTFSSAKVVDLGDRFVEVVHLGRGHTAGDAIVRVPDADVLYAGDLVEESTQREAVPGFGNDCYPLDWPATLDLLTGMVGPSSVVVPGHGLPVDREFVMDQRASIGVVAEMIRDLAGRGVRPEDMGEAGEWPYPAEELAHAFARGLAQLPRSARSSLPML
ncbi:MAG TPA: MBL fold metallo-hydrolase [Nocardioidaceae bacterium]|nr:MBL fold metallo-hydrolase [Nocardioidaceae bacterium]